MWVGGEECVPGREGREMCRYNNRRCAPRRCYQAGPGAIDASGCMGGCGFGREDAPSPASVGGRLVVGAKWSR
jgi:hypothetical protein